MSRDLILQASGVSVSASQTDSQVSKSFDLPQYGPALLRVVVSSATEATGITFKLKDSADNGATYQAVGSESQVSLVKKTFVAGIPEVSTITFPDKATATMGDYFEITAFDGTKWAAALDKQMYEVQTLTFPDKATAAHQDLIIVESAAGTKYAVALTKPVAEVQTLTFPDKATAAHQDFIIVENTAGVQYAVALTKPVAEVQTLTIPAGAAASASRDFVILTDGSGLTWATYFDTSGADAAPSAAAYTAVDASRKIKTVITGLAADTDIVTAMTSALNGLTGFTAAVTLSGTTTLIATMVAKAPCANPVVFAEDGIAAATNFSGAETTAGVASVAPSGPLWTAATYKGLADISADTTAAQVAARAETALNALTGFTAAITTDDTAADGTMTLTQVVKAPVTNPVPKDAAESGAGTITGVQTTSGVASVAPSGPLWTAATYKGLADISGDTTAAQVAARAETAFNALTGFTAAITTDDTAANGTMTLTQTASGPTVNPVPKDAAESGAGTITGVQTVGGVATASPSGAIWTAIPAGRKVAVNILNATTAASVAALVEAALDGLTGFTAVLTTDDSAADGTMTVTQVAAGVVADPAPHNTGDSGAGSISVTVDTAGAVGGVNLATEEMTVTSHGWVTGDQVVAMGTLPTGLVTSTTYYVIRVDANTLKLASTWANAMAGTSVDLTVLGPGTGTLVQANYDIRMIKEDSSDLAQMPFWSPLIVVANTGSGDSCTVSAIYLSE
jgi:hypothetical protein